MADRVYVAQVLSLFSSITPSALMAMIFIINVGVAYDVTADPRLLAVGVAGSIFNVWRIAAMLVLRRLASEYVIGRGEATRFQVHFAIPYVSFAGVMGFFGFLMFRRPEVQLHMLTVCVAVGYCAGVAANCRLRPRLAITSIILAIGPIIFAAVLKGEATYYAMAIVAAAFVAGAARSMIVRTEESRGEIAARISSVSLARRDSLTALPNRLALAEFFDQHLPRVTSDNIIAVHYLDLNGFKPVNDQHGHAVGDELLLAVGRRLRRAIRETDLVARLGGDEFAIVQVDLSNPEEAHALSWRIRDTIDQPFDFDQLSISVSTSIGTAINAEPFASLSEMLDQADAELYRVKRARKKLQLVAV